MANTKVATLGGGCFWCIEAALNQVIGVESAVSGYGGGHIDNPSYRQVISGETGHAEVVQIRFDSDLVSYEQLLEMFFQLHDPTQLNRQGNDVGTQYRSIILAHDQEQQEKAESVIRSLQALNVWDDPIVTQLAPFTGFYPAEEHHQQYAIKNPEQPYCALLIGPKLNAFKTVFSSMIKSS